MTLVRSITGLACGLLVMTASAYAADDRSSSTPAGSSSSPASSTSTPPPVRCPICQAANNQNTPYPQRAGLCLLRGATNAAFGWTELLLQPTAEAEQGGNLAAGVGRGIGMAVKRTGVGFGELFTFWVPKGKQGYPILTEDCPICTLPKVPAPPKAKTGATPPSSP